MGFLQVLLLHPSPHHHLRPPLPPRPAQLAISRAPSPPPPPAWEPTWSSRSSSPSSLRLPLLSSQLYSQLLLRAQTSCQMTFPTINHSPHSQMDSPLNPQTLTAIVLVRQATDLDKVDRTILDSPATDLDKVDKAHLESPAMDLDKVDRTILGSPPQRRHLQEVWTYQGS